MNTLHWKREPIEKEWHLTFDGHEALCGKVFQHVLRNFSRSLEKGPPDKMHKDCQDEVLERIGR